MTCVPMCFPHDSRLVCQGLRVLVSEEHTSDSEVSIPLTAAKATPLPPPCRPHGSAARVSASVI